MSESKPIFYDEERRRWRRTRLDPGNRGRLFHAGAAVFLLNVGRNPELPDILRPDTHGAVHAIPFRAKAKPAARGRKRKVAALGNVPQNYDPLRAAFYVERRSAPALPRLQLHYHDIDLLIPDALHSVSADGALDAEPDPKLTAFLQSLQARNVDLPVMAMINNYDAKTNVWGPPGMLADAGESGGASDICPRRSRSLRTRSTNPASWWTSNRCPNPAWRIFNVSSTIWGRPCTPRT